MHTKMYNLGFPADTSPRPSLGHAKRAWHWSYDPRAARYDRAWQRPRAKARAYRRALDLL